MNNIIAPYQLYQDDILQSYVDFLPNKPYCTDTLGFLVIRPKDIALKYAYIQYNPIHRAYWLIFDLDYDPEWYWPDVRVPTPNMVIITPENRHQHVVYWIDPAIYTLQNARRSPLKLAAEVDRGLTILLKADPCYGKLISKNPLHPRWRIWIFHERKWGLTELLDWIPDRILEHKPKPKEEVGFGRNCTVFDKARFYAYAEWRKQGFKDYERLFERIFDIALNINTDFLVPMQRQEVKSICRSVCKWTARHMSKEGFSSIQKGRNLKSQLVRSTKSKDRAADIIAFKEAYPDMSYRMIAEVFDCNKDTVMKALKSN
jgi:hypothetical protein